MHRHSLVSASGPLHALRTSFPLIRMTIIIIIIIIIIITSHHLRICCNYVVQDESMRVGPKSTGRYRLLTEIEKVKVHPASCCQKDLFFG